VREQLWGLAAQHGKTTTMTEHAQNRKKYKMKKTMSLHQKAPKCNHQRLPDLQQQEGQYDN